MGKMAEVQCPHCKKKFITTIQMFKVPDIKFHCPWCDTYFTQNESPCVTKSG